MDTSKSPEYRGVDLMPKYSWSRKQIGEGKDSPKNRKDWGVPGRRPLTSPMNISRPLDFAKGAAYDFTGCLTPYGGERIMAGDTSPIQKKFRKLKDPPPPSDGAKICYGHHRHRIVPSFAVEIDWQQIATFGRERKPTVI